MSEVRRICAQCGAAVALDGRFCSGCGYDFENALPVSESNLPVALGKAALPMLVGAAGLMLRAGWKLAQSEWAKETARNVLDLAFNRAAQPPAPPPVQSAAQPPSAAAASSRPRRTIRIRTNWAEGDANGVWRRGSSDQTIEIDD